MSLNPKLARILRHESSIEYFQSSSSSKIEESILHDPNFLSKVDSYLRSTPYLYKDAESYNDMKDSFTTELNELEQSLKSSTLEIFIKQKRLQSLVLKLYRYFFRFILKLNHLSFTILFMYYTLFAFPIVSVQIQQLCPGVGIFVFYGLVSVLISYIFVFVLVEKFITDRNLYRDLKLNNHNTGILYRFTSFALSHKEEASTSLYLSLP